MQPISRFFAIITFVLDLILANPGRAIADTFATNIVVNSAPATIDSCEAFSEKVVFTASGKTVPFGKLSPLDVDGRNRIGMAVHLGSAFRVSQPATAVRIAFSATDAFGAPGPTSTITYSGDFSPGALIERTKTGSRDDATDAWQRDVSSVNCEIVAVQLGDGTTWLPSSPVPQSQKPDALPSQTPLVGQVPKVSTRDDHLWLGAGSSANPIYHGHPRYCTVAERVYAWQVEDCHFARIAWTTRQSSQADGSSPQAPAPVASSIIQKPSAATLETQTATKVFLTTCGLAKSSEDIRAATDSIISNHDFNVAFNFDQQAINIMKRCIVAFPGQQAERMQLTTNLASITMNAGICLVRLSRTDESRPLFEEALRLLYTVTNDPGTTEATHAIVVKDSQTIERWRPKG